jgi:hypothetical protein
MDWQGVPYSVGSRKIRPPSFRAGMRSDLTALEA